MVWSLEGAPWFSVCFWMTLSKMETFCIIDEELSKGKYLERKELDMNFQHNLILFLLIVNIYCKVHHYILHIQSQIGEGAFKL